MANFKHALKRGLLGPPAPSWTLVQHAPSPDTHRSAGRARALTLPLIGALVEHAPRHWQPPKHWLSKRLLMGCLARHPLPGHWLSMLCPDTSTHRGSG
eukprot:461142-Pelagomonas_calceolata.AAC.4